MFESSEPWEMFKPKDVKILCLIHIFYINFANYLVRIFIDYFPMLDF